MTNLADPHQACLALGPGAVPVPEGGGFVSAVRLDRHRVPGFDRLQMMKILMDGISESRCRKSDLGGSSRRLPRVTSAPILRSC